VALYNSTVVWSELRVTPNELLLYSAVRLWSMGIRNNANPSPPMIRRMSTSGGIPRTPVGVPIGMALKHILRELNDGHPAASGHMDSTDDLHVSTSDTVYTDSPIGVAPITLRHT
jgi:hypothetical protein